MEKDFSGERLKVSFKNELLIKLKIKISHFMNSNYLLLYLRTSTTFQKNTINVKFKVPVKSIPIF